MTEASRAIPLPQPTELSQAYWDACRRGELIVQRCDDCGEHVFIPQVACTRCFSPNLTWVPSRGRGTVYSFTVVHRPQQPDFAVPYVVAIVEMDEGWYTLTNIVDCDPQAVRIDMPVEVDFRAMSDTITLPFFHPSS
jgi:uncharacterized OB-fold protein